jgi:hypothetical protein
MCLGVMVVMMQREYTVWQGKEDRISGDKFNVMPILSIKDVTFTIPTKCMYS